MRLQLSICVVLYRSADIARRFAAELASSLEGFEEFEICFYDNSPDDELRDLSAFGKYTHDPKNKGFSYANNNLILGSIYENILLLNPDVFGLKREFWVDLHRFFNIRAIRFLRLQNSDGSFQDCVGEAVGLWRALRGARNYEVLIDSTEVDMGIMAFMLTTRSVFAEVGLLDVDYPLYAEDMDWCFRAKRRGVPLVFEPSLALTHIGGASASDRWSARETLRRKYFAERIFVDKHFRGLHWLALRGLNLVKQLLTYT